MGVRRHRAQLLICHQKIAGPSRSDIKEQWCSLKAYAWCFDCQLFVCDIHLASRHDLHDFAVEHPENVTVTAPHGLP